jgi:hypothetical protein
MAFTGRHGRGSLAPVFDNLTINEVTTHFNGQSTISSDKTPATGVSYSRNPNKLVVFEKLRRVYRQGVNSINM